MDELDDTDDLNPHSAAGLDDEDAPQPEVARIRRKVHSAGRDGRVRSKTIAPKRLTRDERRLSELLVYPDDVDRPATREHCSADARGPARSCSCSHHLYLDVNPETGAIKLNFPHLEVWEMAETCSLDVADRGGITLEEVGAILNLTRERIRQVEVRGLAKIKDDDTGDELGLPPERTARAARRSRSGEGGFAARSPSRRIAESPAGFRVDEARQSAILAPHGIARADVPGRPPAAGRWVHADRRAGADAARRSGGARRGDRAGHRGQRADRRGAQAGAGHARDADRRTGLRPPRAARLRSGRGAGGRGGDPRRLGVAETDRLAPRDAFARDHHGRRRAPVGHDQPDATRTDAGGGASRSTRSRCSPAGYAALAANEAEKRAEIADARGA